MMVRHRSMFAVDKASVVQWIEQRRPKALMSVRFRPGAHIFVL